VLLELNADNPAPTRYLSSTHRNCEKYNYVAASLIEVWIDQAERHTWFLSEILQGF